MIWARDSIKKWMPSCLIRGLRGVAADNCARAGDAPFAHWVLSLFRPGDWIERRGECVMRPRSLYLKAIFSALLVPFVARVGSRLCSGPTCSRPRLWSPALSPWWSWEAWKLEDSTAYGKSTSSTIDWTFSSEYCGCHAETSPRVPSHPN